MDKININTDVLNSFFENMKTVSYDLFSEVCYEGNLKIAFQDIINSALVPNYFSDLLNNADELQNYLNTLAGLIGDYSNEMVQLEGDISSNVESKINLELQISSLSFGYISFINKFLYGFQELQLNATVLANLFIASLKKEISKQKTSNLNIPDVGPLTQEEEATINNYINQSETLEEVSTTLSEIDKLKLQEYLKNVFNGAYNQFTNTASVILSVIFNTLGNVAGDKNIKLEDVLNNNDNASIVKEHVSDVSNSLNGGSKKVTLMQDLTNFASKNNLTLEELLSGKNNKILTSYVMKIENVSDIIKIFEKFNPKELSTYLNELYNSDSIKKSVPLSLIFEYLNLTSKNNGITINDLLTNNEYMSILMDSLKKINV